MLKLTKSQKKAVSPLLDDLKICLQILRDEGEVFTVNELQVMQDNDGSMIKVTLNCGDSVLVVFKQLVTKRGKLLSNLDGSTSVMTLNRLRDFISYNS